MGQRTLILLASNSPRRRELMALGNWTLGVCVSSVDETPGVDEAPADYVLRLAEAKARAAIPHAASQQYIVGADTTVVDGNSLLGKPADASEALRMLTRLRGHVHQVYTGLAVLDIDRQRVLRDLCVTAVPMRNYSDAEMRSYVRSRDPLDKAGAYAIQNIDFHPVENLAGCYASVAGLPLCHLTRLLARLHSEPQPDIAARCQTHLKYSCPVWRSILRGEQVG